MEQENTQQNNTEQNTLSLNDVILMHNIIATVSRRGAFEAAEFEIVGSLFNKLKALLPEQPAESVAETANTSEEVPDNQLSFDFAQGQEAETQPQA
jgi:hypothetical protein